MKAMLKTPPDMEAVARLSKDPMDNSTMHTTCVATHLSGGHADNALPQWRRPTWTPVEPGHTLEEVRVRCGADVGLRHLRQGIAAAWPPLQTRGHAGGVHGRVVQGILREPRHRGVWRSLEHRLQIGRSLRSAVGICRS